MLCTALGAAQTEAPLPEPPPVADQFIVPEPLPPNRYAVIWEKSPFALKTAAPALEAGRSFAAELNLAGLADVDGEVTVYLKNSKSGEYLTVTPTATPESDVVLVKINEHEDPQQVSVEVRKGTETATVKYPAEISSEKQLAANVKGQNLAGVDLDGRAAQAGRNAGANAANPRLQPPVETTPVDAEAGMATGQMPNPNVQRNRRRIMLPTTPAVPDQGKTTTAPQVQEALTLPDGQGADDEIPPSSTEELPPP